MNINSVIASLTVEEALRRGEERLRQRGVEGARREAEDLLACILNLARWRLFLERPRLLHPRETRDFGALLSRREKREPLAYILGETGFHELVLRADRRALIPRPETELLVTAALTKVKLCPSPRSRILEIGCGSGNVALALVREEPEIEVFASDLSPDAVALARENAAQLNLESRVEFRVGDMFAPWEEYRRDGFHLVISNPPYVPRSELESLPPEISRFEPRLALDGGEDGLAIIRRLLRESGDYLIPGGWLLLEIGAGESSAVKKIIEDSGIFKSLEIVRDYNGHERVVMARKRGEREIRKRKLAIIN